MKKSLEEYAKEYVEALGLPEERLPSAIETMSLLTEKQILALIRVARIEAKLLPTAEAEDWSEERWQEVMEFERAWGDNDA